MISIKSDAIKAIRLPSPDEVKALPTWIIATGSAFWLNTPGSDKGYINRKKDYSLKHVAAVRPNGAVDSFGYDVDLELVGVLPLLKVDDVNSCGLCIGETVSILGLLAHYVGNDSLLLCEPICNRRYDAESSDYDKSELKRYLAQWLNKNKQAKRKKQNEHV